MRFPFIGLFCEKKYLFPLSVSRNLEFFGEKLSSSNEYPLCFVPPKLLDAVQGSCVNFTVVPFQGPSDNGLWL